jgi:hypothetical protein
MTSMLARIGLPFIPGWTELRPFVADLWLIVTIVAMLITPFFTRGRTSRARWSPGGRRLAFVSQLAVAYARRSGAERHFRGLLVADQFALCGSCCCCSSSRRDPDVVHDRRVDHARRRRAGVLRAAARRDAGHVADGFDAEPADALPRGRDGVAAELRAGRVPQDHRIGAEASLKYVLFGAATSAVMAYGLSYLYGLYGTLQVADSARHADAMRGGGGRRCSRWRSLRVDRRYRLQISAVPFPTLVSDVFEGASIDVTTFPVVASKGAARAAARVLTLLAALGFPGHRPRVAHGAIARRRRHGRDHRAPSATPARWSQNNIKRLLAYSLDRARGYMLCALSLLVATIADRDRRGSTSTPPRRSCFTWPSTCS